MRGGGTHERADAAARSDARGDRVVKREVAQRAAHLREHALIRHVVGGRRDEHLEPVELGDGLLGAVLLVAAQVAHRPRRAALHVVVRRVAARRLDEAVDAAERAWRGQ